MVLACVMRICVEEGCAVVTIDEAWDEPCEAVVPFCACQ